MTINLGLPIRFEFDDQKFEQEARVTTGSDRPVRTRSWRDPVYTGVPGLVSSVPLRSIGLDIGSGRHQGPKVLLSSPGRIGCGPSRWFPHGRLSDGKVWVWGRGVRKGCESSGVRRTYRESQSGPWGRPQREDGR